MRIQTETSVQHQAIRAELEPLVGVFEVAGDDRGSADVLRLLGRLATWSFRYAEAAEIQERALGHARAAGDERREAGI